MSTVRTDYIMICTRVKDSDLTEKQLNIIYNYEEEEDITFDVIYNEGDGCYYLGYVIAHTKEFEGFKEPVDISNLENGMSFDRVEFWLIDELELFSSCCDADVRCLAFSTWG